jgi:hypothetical protein
MRPQVQSPRPYKEINKIKIFKISKKMDFPYGICVCVCVCVWGLNSRLHVYKAGALLLEPNLHSILLWLFWRWGSHKLFALETTIFLLDLSFATS